MTTLFVFAIVSPQLTEFVTPPLTAIVSEELWRQLRYPFSLGLTAKTLSDPEMR